MNLCCLVSTSYLHHIDMHIDTTNTSHKKKNPPKDDGFLKKEVDGGTSKSP